MKNLYYLSSVLIILSLVGCKGAATIISDTPPTAHITIGNTTFDAVQGSQPSGQPLVQLQPIIAMNDISALSINDTPLRHDKPKLLTAENSEDNIVINKIVGWLNSSTAAEGTIDVGRHGYPSTIQFQLKNGDNIMIEPAVDCITKQLSNGSEKTCTKAKGEIFLHSKTNTLRLASPKLYDWIMGGFKVQ